MKFPWLLIIAFSLCGLLSGCLLKRITSEVSIQRIDVPLFIQMPRNLLVFDNVAPLLYDAVHEQYALIGYHLVDTAAKGYTLKIKIKNLEPTTKLVSPDIILLHYVVRLELECELLDFAGKSKARKTFLSSGLISKPQNPTLNSDFLDFYYKRLFRQAAHKIEHYFRRFLTEDSDLQ